MQKKIIALAVAGLVSGAAFAQSNVTIYGVADVGVEIGKSDTDKGTKFRVQSGQSAGSRIGFKGEEALGNGLKAVWLLEQGFAIDNGKATAHTTPAGDTQGTGVKAQTDNTTLFQRQAYAGLSSNYGTLTFGRQYTPFYTIKANTDTFGLGTAGTWNNVAGFAIGNADRLNNSVVYASPVFSGFSGALVYSSGNENNTSTNNTATDPKTGGRTWAGLAQYNANNAYVGLGYQATDLNVSSVADGVIKGKAWMLAGNYDFKVAKVYAGYARGKATDGGGEVYKGRTYHLGVGVPFGAHTFKLGYSHGKDTTTGMTGDTKTSLWGLGYEYAMSKRTSLYAAYAAMDIGNNSQMASVATGALSAPALNSATTTGLTSAVDKNPNALQFGMRHSF